MPATLSAWPEAERVWLLEIRCWYGIVYPFGGEILAAWTDHPRVGARLRRLPFILTARGDLEVVVAFHLNDVEMVLAVLKPYRRRRLSEAQRAKNTETLARARRRTSRIPDPERLPGPGSTRGSMDSLRHHPQPKIAQRSLKCAPVSDSGQDHAPDTPQVPDDVRRHSGAADRHHRRSLTTVRRGRSS